MARAENQKIAATNRNMHMTGKEKTLAITPVHEVLAAVVAVSGAESGVVGTGIFTTSNCKERCRELTAVLVPRQRAQIIPQPCGSRLDARPQILQKERRAAFFTPRSGHNRGAIAATARIRCLTLLRPE